MAMGVPVVATDVGGPAEIVRPGLDGLLLPPRDPIAWSRGLGPLLDGARKRQEMGGHGLARARDFSLGAHAAAIRALYRDLLLS
jgi:glycosyltransferase involved in cell wall biosynthesis